MQKKKECKYFLQGVCNKGDHCKFAHSNGQNQFARSGISNISNGGQQNRPMHSNNRQNIFDNKPSKANIKNQNPKYRKQFKEDFYQKQDHQQPQQPYQQSQQPYQQQPYQQQPYQQQSQFQEEPIHKKHNNKYQNNQKACKFHQQGNCKFGDNCNYEHIDSQNKHRQKRKKENEMQIDQSHYDNKLQINQQDNNDQQNQLIMNQCKEFFTKGNCQYRNKCRKSHDATLKQDLLIFGKQKYSNQSIVQILTIRQQNQQDQLLIVCSDRMVLLNEQYETINQEMQPEQNKIDYVIQHQQCLFIGFYDQHQKISTINVITQNQPIQFGQISPAHEDRIIKMIIYEDHLVTASLDKKVKIWKINGSQQFGLQSVYTHSQKIMAIEMIDNLIIVGDSDGGLYILQVQNQIEVLKQFEKYHDNAINSISKFNNYIFTVSLDGRMKLMDSKQQVQDYQMNGPISYIGFVKNRKQNQLIVLGYCDGNVELYDDNVLLYGKIPTHSYQKTGISMIYNQFSNVNEVVNSKLLIADLAGMVSFWEFDNL